MAFRGKCASISSRRIRETNYQQESPDRYRLLAKVPSDIGARTSDYPGSIGMKAFDRFYVAVPEGVRHGAQVWMYSVQK